MTARDVLWLSLGGLFGVADLAVGVAARVVTVVVLLALFVGSAGVLLTRPTDNH